MPGPAPKHPSQRARRNTDPVPVRLIDMPRARLPQEPPADLLPDGETWHPATLRLWSTWRDSLLSAEFVDVDVSTWETIARLHHEFMSTGRAATASELRQMLAAYGDNPAARAKLRIFMADADEKDEKRKSRAGRPPAGEPSGPYAGLRLVADDAAETG